MKMKVCVIGLGYIGLPTAAIFASCGVEVLGVDVNPKVIETINQGRIHIVEQGLESLVSKVVQNGSLKASLKPDYADVFIICVPTPFKENHQPNCDYIQSATLALAPYLKKDNIVILESTSPVGTTQKIAQWLSGARNDLRFPQNPSDTSDVFLAHCPERVLPGQILKELVENDRIVGGITPQCTAKAMEVYQTFVRGKCIPTDAKTAEMAKLVENSFRDVNIAFANELSIICDKANINVYELICLANHHPRVNILQPGCGVGGHCIAVDPWFVVADFPEARLIKTAREVNDYKSEFVITKVLEKLQSDLSKKVACLGLSFKPNIDDLRESPALRIAESLAKKLKNPLLIVEPHIDRLPEELSHNAKLCSLQEAKKADLVIILVGHQEFMKTDFTSLNVLDFVNVKP